MMASTATNEVDDPQLLQEFTLNLRALVGLNIMAVTKIVKKHNKVLGRAAEARVTASEAARVTRGSSPRPSPRRHSYDGSSACSDDEESVSTRLKSISMNVSGPKAPGEFYPLDAIEIIQTKLFVNSKIELIVQKMAEIVTRVDGFSQEMLLAMEGSWRRPTTTTLAQALDEQKTRSPLHLPLSGMTKSGQYNAIKTEDDPSQLPGLSIGDSQVVNGGLDEPSDKPPSKLMQCLIDLKCIETKDRITWLKRFGLLVLIAGFVVAVLIIGGHLSDTFQPTFSAAAQAVCHVYVIICIGAFATWWGKFEKPARKGLNGLCKDLLLPCLLLAQVPGAVTASRLERWWLLPAFAILQCGLGLGAGWFVALFVADNKNIKQFIMAVVAFPNTTSIPLTLVSAMFLVITFNVGTSESDETAHATALILVYTTFMNIMRWTVGYTLLMPPADDEPIESVPSPKSLAAKPDTGDDTVSDTDQSDHAGADTPRDGPGLAYGPNHPHTPKLDPKSSLKLVPVVEPPTSSKKPAAIPLSARLKKSFNAPSIMAIFAIILGLITPIRSEFFVDDAVARPAFTWVGPPFDWLS
eukprot:TRINITY_DN2761_c0_g1_i10.p1 TRINITY_DN2761_c0_g1~~TRINITY_DN2761_c0_g1_i10.p1  ORF type:complete len:580 (+),score=133.85 TRINITY_DN2761_c0_g1_i10:112-1851(+)